MVKDGCLPEDCFLARLKREADMSAFYRGAYLASNSREDPFLLKFIDLKGLAAVLTTNI